MVTGGEGRPVAILIGPPGAGKTTIGEALAAALEVDFHDTDAAIEDEQGCSISDIFVLEGESAFRALERAEVARAVSVERGVVALGGGAPMDSETQAVLADHVVVFLDVGIADAAKRVGFDGSRPLLAMNPRASWTKLMNERRPTYDRVATHHIDTAGRPVDDIVGEIAERLRAAR
ncbi:MULTISPECIES: shikimate kinase [unclassified Knoellia]|uniref:shikimate kinase n=1 Tax=Knoellia altitudinis TaxID=3404795 RepID=UPI00361D412C